MWMGRNLLTGYKPLQQGCMIPKTHKEVMQLLRESVFRNEPMYTGFAATEFINSNLPMIILRETILLAFHTDAALFGFESVSAALHEITTIRQARDMLEQLAAAPKIGLVAMADIIGSFLISSTLPSEVWYAPTYCINETNVLGQALINGFYYTLSQRTYAATLKAIHIAAAMCYTQKTEEMWKILILQSAPNWEALHRAVFNPKRPWGRARYIVISAILYVLRGSAVNIPLPQVQSSSERIHSFPEWAVSSCKWTTFQMFHERLQPHPDEHWAASADIRKIGKAFWKEFNGEEFSTGRYEEIHSHNDQSLSPRRRLRHDPAFALPVPFLIPDAHKSNVIPILPVMQTQGVPVFGTVPVVAGYLNTLQAADLQWLVPAGEYAVFETTRSEHVAFVNSKLRGLLNTIDPSHVLFSPVKTYGVNNNTMLVVERPAGRTFSLEEIMQDASLRLRLLAVWLVCTIWALPLPPVEHIAFEPRAAWIQTQESASWNMFALRAFGKRLIDEFYKNILNAHDLELQRTLEVFLMNKGYA